VRELSHHLQFELLKSARKRMEKHIPSIVGSWLAGTYDRDRVVSKAANDGITSFLDTPSKVLSLWRKCQLQILEYAQESIKETPQTLSDERNVSPDDVQEKYDRVMGASLSLVINLLLKLDDHDVQSQKESYEGFLSNKTLWSFVASEDPFLRRTSSQLLSVCLDKQNEFIGDNLELISHAFISEGLRAPHFSSGVHFLKALTKLTDKFPQVWLASYKGKRSALFRLRHFIEKGSQNGPPEYWQVLSSLLLSLPSGVLPTDLDGVIELLKAHRDGISQRDEARTNAPTAWASYFNLTKHLEAGLADKTNTGKLLRDSVYPVFEQYLFPAPGHSIWSVGNSTAALARAFQICWLSEKSEQPQAITAEWARLAEKLTTDMLTSQPEQSKDYTKSQAAILAEAHRWFALQAEIIKSAKSPKYQISTETVITFLVAPNSALVTKALEMLRNRNGKPYSAAGVLEAALCITPELVSAEAPTVLAIASFLEDDAPKLILSPSSKYLTASLYAFRSLPEQDTRFTVIWQATLDALLATPDSDRKLDVVQGLISDHGASHLAQSDSTLQDFLLEYASRLTQGQQKEWSLFENAVEFDSFSSETSGSIITSIVESLSGDAVATKGSLPALETIVQKNPQLLRKGGVNELTIRTRLLTLTESNDPAIISRANTLKTALDRGDKSSAECRQVSSPTLEIIKENLENAGPQSLA
jgi:hypothetical protein